MPRGNRVGQMVCLQSPAGDLSGTHIQAILPSSGWGWLLVHAPITSLHPDDPINLP